MQLGETAVPWQMTNNDEPDLPFEIEITDTLDLHTIPPRDMRAVVEEYLHQCSQKRLRFVRIIHGKGTGFQKQTVRKILSASNLVESFEDGPDWGSTAIILK